MGGVVDIAAGIAFLQAIPTQSPMEMGSQVGSSMSSWIGYFLVILGVIVLLSGAYLLVIQMMKKSILFGRLMIFYGIVMLALGVGMIGQTFSRMQASTLSGSVMILLGISMLYSGFEMTRMRKSM